jgi:ribosomal protein L37AE/L43A
MSGKDVACKACGKAFQRGPKQAARRYCSDECWKRNARSLATADCQTCGQTFQFPLRTAIANPVKRKYCSDTCRQHAKKLRTGTCQVCHIEFKYRCISNSKMRRTCSEECLRRLLMSHRPHRPTVTCEKCGKDFQKRSGSGRDSNRFCSRMCGGTLKTPEMKQADAAAKAMRKMIRQEMRRVMREERLRAIERERSCPKLRSWICNGCGKKTETYGRLLRTCGECKAVRLKKVRKIAKHRRRVAKKNAEFVPVHPDVIFERDRWKCCHCGCKVSKKYDPNHDHYPNLDHVIPISKGGSHRPENLQCLCRACNMEKSDSRVNLF